MKCYSLILKRFYLLLVTLITVLLYISPPVLAKPFAYITSRGDSTVSVMDTATDTIVDVIQVGANPVRVAVHPDGSKVYVLCNRGVDVIDTSFGLVTNVISDSTR